MLPDRGDDSVSVVGYIRVSTDRQDESGAGLDAQRAAIERECAHRDWELARIEQDVLSGRTLKRPGLQRALEDCERQQVDGIVVARLDRLSRSLVDFAGLLERAQRGGWNIVALDLGVDLSTPSGEFLANVMASAAQWERRIIGERTREALQVRRAQGVRLGRPATIGEGLAAWIWELRRYHSPQQVCDLLNEDGIPTPRGGREWRPSSLRAVFPTCKVGKGADGR